MDPNFLWTNWDCGTVVEGCEAGGNMTPIVEELLVHVKSPFHEVRIAAAGYISGLFSSVGTPAEKVSWQKRVFANLFTIIKSSFIVEVSTTSESHFIGNSSYS